MAVTGGTNRCLAPGLGDWNALEVTGFCSDVATAHGSPQLIGKEAFGQLPGFGSTRALPHSLFTLMERDVTCWNPGSSQQSGRKKELETTVPGLRPREAALGGDGQAVALGQVQRSRHHRPSPEVAASRPFTEPTPQMQARLEET